MKYSTYQCNVILRLSGSQGKALLLLESKAEFLPDVWLPAPETNISVISAVASMTL